jgi:hypothetical protein
VRDEHHRESHVDGEQWIVMGDDDVSVERERNVWYISGRRERHTIEPF